MKVGKRVGERPESEGVAMPGVGDGWGRTLGAVPVLGYEWYVPLTGGDPLAT